MASGETIRDSVFRNNTAGSEGGAIQLDGVDGHAELQISNTLFDSNHSGYAGGGIKLGMWGGGTFALNSTVHIEDTLFENNSADYQGGAISVGSHETQARLELERVEFTGNAGASLGGAIDLDVQGGGVTLTADETVFDANSAGDMGGAIYVGPLTGPVNITVTNCSITNNIATHSVPAGIVLWTTSTLTSENTDWGSGATYNLVGDIGRGDLEHTGCTGYWDSFGAAQSFTCGSCGECE